MRTAKPLTRRPPKTEAVADGGLGTQGLQTHAYPCSKGMRHRWAEHKGGREDGFAGNTHCWQNRTEGWNIVDGGGRGGGGGWEGCKERWKGMRAMTWAKGSKADILQATVVLLHCHRCT